MRKSETRDIDGLKVTAQQLPPRKGFKLAARLFKYIAPILAAKGATEEVDIESLTPALMTMMRELDDVELDTLMSQVLSGCYVIDPAANAGKGQKWELDDPAKIDLAFDGKLGSMMQAMKFAIEVNFGDFFDGAAPSDAAVTTSK